MSNKFNFYYFKSNDRDMKKILSNHKTKDVIIEISTSHDNG